MTQQVLAAPTAEALSGSRKQSSFRAPPLWLLGVAIGAVAVATYVYVPRLFTVETDDAYVQADTVTVVPKVAAYVTALHIDDNTRFRKGQILMELDPRDFQNALASAAADLSNAVAAKTDAEAQLTEQNATIAAAEAAIDGDRSTLSFAEQQLSRYGSLARDGAGTAERWQEAQSDIGERKAGLARDTANLAAAKIHAEVLASKILEEDAAIARAKAAVAQARLNLSYTKIYATDNGTVANRSVQLGNFVQPGQTLFSAVPEKVYVVANFKETQLDHMQAGQKATIRIDAYPDRPLTGHVDSLQRGTGSTFALLPPENATGNFVKVTQRVPVKILLDGAPDTLRTLAPGMSVEATVEFRTAPSWLRWWF
jgi:membrane fusion protein (multidrug efflux system)